MEALTGVNVALLTIYDMCKAIDKSMELTDAIADGSWRGYPIYNPRELANIVTRYHEEGWQVAIHGNGDAGIEDILNAFEEAQIETIKLFFKLKKYFLIISNSYM